jgi:hypothetical protein
MRFDQFMDIETKDDFADFVDALIEDLAPNSDEWENPDLARFLSAMAAWTRSSDQYAKASGDGKVTSPSWSTFAKVLSASRVYE